MASLPPEARDGLTRAWLSILRDRHPGVAWVAAERPTTGTDNLVELRRPRTAQGGELARAA